MKSSGQNPESTGPSLLPPWDLAQGGPEDAAGSCRCLDPLRGT